MKEKPGSTEIAALVEQHLSPSEKALYLNLIEAKDVTLAIPDNAPVEQILTALAAVTKVNAYGRKVVTRLKPVLGRLLRIVKERELWREMGYQTWDDFMSKGCPEQFDLPRSEAYNAIRLAESFPSLSSDEAVSIGLGKLNDLAKVVSEEDPNCRRYLEVAKTTPRKELRAVIHKEMAITSGDLNSEVLTIFTTESIAQRWKQFVTNPYIQQYCATGDHGKILERMIEECEGHWGAQMEHELRGRMGQE